MKKITKISAMLLTAILSANMLSACTNSSPKTSSEVTTAKTDETAKKEEASSSEQKTEANAYPIKTDTKISYWLPLNANVSANYSSLGETDFGKNLQEQTGISIDFQHPAVGQETEQFNLLLSNPTLPDIIEWQWFQYDGGPEKAIKDGVIIPLNDVIDKYCPNLKAYLKENPEVDKMVKTDDGNYYCFPFVRGGDLLLTSMGPMLRGDWLEELGLEVPTTIDEWENVLKEFKEKKGASGAFAYWYSVPDLTNNNPFAYAYNATRTFYLGNDGKIKYGAVEDGYKEYLKKMNQWMSEGLLDADLATLTNDQVAAKITNGSAGASFAWGGSGMGNWTRAGQATDPNYKLVPAPYPTLKAGEKPEMGHRDNPYPGGLGCAAISSDCKNVELAAKLLDYAYSKEGHTLYNFGKEGVSYTMVDGNPTYTDELLKNPNLSITHAMAGHVRANYNGPFVQDEGYILQYWTLDEQKKALDLWTDTNMVKHVVPPVTPTAEESKEMARIMNDINTYRDEYTLKFILGTVSMDEWDNYISTIKGMGLDKVLEIQNAALERYKSR